MADPPFSDTLKFEEANASVPPVSLSVIVNAAVLGLTSHAPVGVPRVKLRV